jgi:hypothetical protein
MQSKRGGFLTVMAILLALVAIEDVLKPLLSPSNRRNFCAPVKLPECGGLRRALTLGAGASNHALVDS